MNKKLLQEKGFTIVELLIVIVVIGILAAITIVAYNGVQNRAKTSGAQNTANSIAKKAEIYNTDDTAPSTGYPPTLAALTGAASSALYAVPASSVTAATSLTNASSQNSVIFHKCGTNGTATAPTTAAGITIVTGSRVFYRDYTAGTSTSFANAGVTSGTDNGFPIACFTSNS